MSQLPWRNFLHHYVGPDITIEYPENTPISGLRIDMFLRNFLNENTPYFKIDRNHLTVKASSEAMSKKLMELKSINEISIKTTEKNKYNFREGTILIDLFRPGPDDSDEFLKKAIKEILEIRNNKVEEVEIYTRPNKFKTKNLKFAKIKFLQQDIPKEIFFGNSRIPIQEVLPKPMLCSKCLLFGHTYKRCKQEVARCNRCGSLSHNRNDCNSELKCFNCGCAHGVSDFKCSHFKFHQEILIRMRQYGLSYRQARKDMRIEGRDIDSRPWATRIHLNVNHSIEEKSISFNNNSVNRVDINNPFSTLMQCNTEVISQNSPVLTPPKPARSPRKKTFPNKSNLSSSETLEQLNENPCIVTSLACNSTQINKENPSMPFQNKERSHSLDRIETPPMSLHEPENTIFISRKSDQSASFLDISSIGTRSISPKTYKKKNSL